MHFFWILTVEIAEEGEELFFSFENSLYKKLLEQYSPFLW